jgi:hypothetical protein
MLPTSLYLSEDSAYIRKYICFFSFSLSLSLFFFLWYWGLNLGPTLEPLHQPFFVMALFAVGSHELFAQAGFEPHSS